MDDARDEKTAPPAAPRQRIGRYEVLHPLGQGGMGKVLLAKDSVLGRLVAVKVTRDDLALPPDVRLELLDRMRNEARAAAGLSHPSMVTLHDMGEEPAVGLYLVFEYVDGPTLRDRLADGPLPASEVAKLARQLGDALATAHEAGVIHRDVKPENVLLARAGAKLADFGIARLPDSTHTRAGVVLGTPAYSAPEALAAAQFSPESDQFSLAATLYEAIRGVGAFRGEDALRVAARVANEEAPPLDPSTTFDAARANAILVRALSKEPKRRFASCRELGEAFAAALERRPTLPPPPDGTVSVTRSSISLVPKSTQRRQNIAAGTAALVIVGLLLFGRREATEAADGASLKAVSARFAAAIDRRASQVRPSAPAPHTRPGTSRDRHGDPAIPSPQAPELPPEPLSTPAATSSAPASSSSVPSSLSPASSSPPSAQSSLPAPPRE
jgi:serine/threonine-protein kinase